jgi:hypothetical protein
MSAPKTVVLVPKEVQVLKARYGVSEEAAQGMDRRNRSILLGLCGIAEREVLQAPEAARIPEKYRKALQILAPHALRHQPYELDEERARAELLALDLEPWGPGTGEHAARRLLEWRCFAPDFLYQLMVLLALGHSENVVWQILEDF